MRRAICLLFAPLLVQAQDPPPVLPDEGYGEKAVSRGDANTRLITLRNLGWEPVTRRVRLDGEIGHAAMVFPGCDVNAPPRQGTDQS